MLEFSYPLVFLMLPLPLLVYWLSTEFRDQAEAVRTPFFIRIVNLTGRTPASGAAVVTKTRVQKFLVLTIWLFIVASLARPEWVGEPIVRETAARDLLLIVDLSGSMDEADFTDTQGQRVTRLTAVKQVLGEFIAKRETDRLGLALFGSAAFLQTPFTTDLEAVEKLLDELQVNMAGPQTMIGDAIGLAVRLFEVSATENKVVVLLTDGNDRGSAMPLDRAARIAADENITIYTIAIGDPQTVGEKALDIPALENISKLTKGKFFLALNRQDLDSIYRELDRLEPQLIETISYRPKESMFHYPLALAVLLGVFLALYMSTRKTAVAKHA